MITDEQRESNALMFRELGRDTYQLHRHLVEAMGENAKAFRSKKGIILFILLVRVCGNLMGAIAILLQAMRTKGNLIFKLPLGLCLRGAMIDALTALYFDAQSEESAVSHLEVTNLQYAKSLLERLEVYKDKVHSVSPDFDDDLVEHFYELGLEDNFLQYFDVEVKDQDLRVKPMKESEFRRKGALVEGSYPNLKQMHDHLITFPEYSEKAKRLYHYYKYFSQYEHFSELGFGDVKASFGEDNIHMPSAIKTLKDAVDLIFEHLRKENQAKPNI